ncbi:MAG TPA: flagellin [Bryobacteraceae bacterium]|nr:flagellin [Bryobacteraceae bacterium]
MSFSIQTNVSSLAAQENLRVNGEFQNRTIARLTSGYRINSSGDDAAGLAVANKFRSDVAELAQGVRNANDGISTLQIIDGGLNNISKIVDRLKTLATQSASSTFSGDRTTLNTEYQALLTEINRQAANVGLSTGSHGGRYNTDISVYVGGGGSTQANSKVTISLSGSTNRVDASGLALSGTSIAGGAATEMTGNSKDISSATTLLTGSATQNFTFNISKDGQAAFSTTVTVTGDSDGISGTDAVAQLNSALNSYGISASINSTSGEVQFSGDVAFTATTTGAGGVGVTSNGASTVVNGSMYRVAGQAAWAAMGTSGADLTFTVGSQSVTVALAQNVTMADALTQLNGAIRPLGVYAVLDVDSNNIEFQSAATFTVAQANGTATEGIFAADGTATTTSPSTTSSATSAAEAAITAITSAVSRLGAVQGKVGTAQNKLQYAIQLAQSQISNFSAADSRIRDADVAAEAANLTKAQVLQQASLAAMAQANSAPQAVMALLRG